MKQLNLKKVLYIIYGLAVVCLVLILLGAAFKSFLLIVLGLLSAVACIVFSLVKWRCPHCGAHLGRDLGKYCSHCGQHLVDLE